jgi:hypothetical protein
MSGFHKLCGINPDQHFYLHLNKEMDFQHLDFTITSVAAGRSLFFVILHGDFLLYRCEALSTV